MPISRSRHTPTTAGAPYTTEEEIHFLHELHDTNYPSFKLYANLILTKGRGWDPQINVDHIETCVRALLTEDMYTLQSIQR